MFAQKAEILIAFYKHLIFTDITNNIYVIFMSYIGKIFLTTRQKMLWSMTTPNRGLVNV
jgi:hypothetical protein